MADADVQVTIGAKLDDLNAGVGEAKGVLDDLGSSLSSLAGLAGVAFSAAGLKEFIESMTELGVQTQNQAEILGTSTENVAALGVLAASSGISVEQLTMSMSRLSLNLDRAEKGGTATGFALEALGLNAKDLMAMPLDTQLDAFGAAFARLQDGPIKDEIALQTFGLRAQQVIPVLDALGKGGLKASQDIATAAGLGLPEFIAASEKTHQALNTLKDAFTGLNERVFVAIASAVQDLAKAFTKLFESVTTQDIKGWFQGFDDIVASTATDIQNITTGINALKSAWEYLKSLQPDPSTTAASRFGKPPLPTQPSAAPELAGAGTGGGAGAGGGANAPDPAALQAAQQEAIAGFQRQLQAAQQTFAQQSALYTQDADMYNITQQKKYELLQAALATAYNAEVAAVQSEQALNNLSVQQKDEMFKQLQALRAAYELKEQELNTQSLEQQKTMWMQYTSFVTSQMQGMLTSLLQGTLNWQTETRKIFQDLVLFFAGIVEKFVSNWAAGELARLTATTATNTAQVASTTTAAAATVTAQQTAAAGGILATIESATASIMASVGQTIAGVTAFLSPIMGPAALPEGIVTGTALEATALGSLDALDVGAWNLPGNLVAQLHQGEMVIPANFAEGLRQSGGFGGGVHVHFTNNGGGMTDDEIMRHSGTIAKAVQQEMRNFNRSLR